MKASRTVGGIKEITKYMTVSQLGTHPFSTPCCVYVEIFSSKSTVHFPEDVNSSLARLFHLPFGVCPRARHPEPKVKLTSTEKQKKYIKHICIHCVGVQIFAYSISLQKSRFCTPLTQYIIPNNVHDIL